MNNSIIVPIKAFSLPNGHPLPKHRLLASAHSRANKLESAAAAGCQLGLLTAIWGARLSESSPAGTSGRGRMSSASLIQSDSDGQVQRGELMAKVFLLSGQCLKRWTWRSQCFLVQQGMCAWVHVHVCVWWAHVHEWLFLGACMHVKRSSRAINVKSDTEIWDQKIVYVQFYLCFRQWCIKYVDCDLWPKKYYIFVFISVNQLII